MTHMCFLDFSHQYQHNFSFQSHRLLFSHASAEVRGENTPERKVASTRDQTHNHQVMSPTRSPLSHPGRATSRREDNSTTNDSMVMKIQHAQLHMYINIMYKFQRSTCKTVGVKALDKIVSMDRRMDSHCNFSISPSTLLCVCVCVCVWGGGGGYN